MVHENHLENTHGPTNYRCERLDGDANRGREAEREGIGEGNREGRKDRRKRRDGMGREEEEQRRKNDILICYGVLGSVQSLPPMTYPNHTHAHAQPPTRPHHARAPPSPTMPSRPLRSRFCWMYFPHD